MRIDSCRLVTLILGMLILLLLTTPPPSGADPYWYGTGEGERHWGALQHEHAELDQAYAMQQRDWERLHHERREMHEARWAGDWPGYEQERREAEQAACAVRRDQAHLAHEQREGWQQQHTFHPRRAWEDD